MLVTFRTFRDPWEAHLFRTRLEADGIPAFVAFDQHISVYWGLSQALGGVQVLVPAEMLDEANGVVKNCVDGTYRSELAEMFDMADGETLACPRCGSTDIRRRPNLQQILFGAGLTLLFGSAMRLELTRFSCKSCGKRWRTDRDTRH